MGDDDRRSIEQVLGDLRAKFARTQGTTEQQHLQAMIAALEAEIAERQNRRGD